MRLEWKTHENTIKLGSVVFVSQPFSLDSEVPRTENAAEGQGCGEGSI